MEFLFLLEMGKSCPKAKQNTLLMLHKTTSGKTPSKFAIPVENPVISELLLGSCHFSSLIFHDCILKFSKQNVSYYEPFQSRLKGI